MTNSLSIVPANPRFIEAIKGLLQSENLPVEDLPINLKHFFIATDNGFVIGSIGLEIYGNFGLLRSLAVKPEYRNMRVAGELISKLEGHARAAGLESIYLLTETAVVYFEKNGFIYTQRSDVPDTVQQSREFSHICPQSAKAMVKKL